MLDMPDKVKSKISQLLSAIGAAYKTSVDVEIAEEVMPEASIWVDADVNIYWSAKSMTEVKEALARFAKRGIMIEKVSKSDTKPVWYLKGKHSTIILSPQWSEDENAACRLVKVGEELKPVYKLVCSEFPVES